MRASNRAALIAALSLNAAVSIGASQSVSTAPAADDSKVSMLTGEQVIQILDETVDWYRTLGTQQQNATQPSDLLILFANRQTADKVVALAFEIARANAELLSSEATSTESAADASSAQALNQQQAQIAAQRQAIQQEMAGGHTRSGGDGKESELRGELAMVDARKNLLDTMTEFVGESDPKGAGANALKAHIDAIAATIPSSAVVPAAAATAPGSAATAASTATASAPAEMSKPVPTKYGIWDLATAVLRLRGKMRTIDVIDQHTAALAHTFTTISAAPLAQLKSYSARSDQLAGQADKADPQALAPLRAQFDTLAWLFKQTSAILIPLSKEGVLLQQYRHNLNNWREATGRQYHDALAALGVRMALLAAVLVVIFALGEVWRRAVMRYAHEARRRYQLLLVRKAVVWTVVIAVIGLNVVTELSTFATFAGLLTAGIAVAMQSVLVSVVGYFFLIGKYGIRVGDRIQIGAVVGEVIDLGLVRLHLMELNSSGPLGPTGRVVAFANLIVFQTSGGLFKQIPGVSLSWRETVLTLPAGANYLQLKEQILAAIRGVLADYGEEMTRQTREIERTTASAVREATPEVQLRLAAGHMEALIRYPIHVQDAADIDERVSAAVLAIIEKAAKP